MSGHPIDSINLKDPRLGIYEQLAEFVARAGVGKGRLHIALDRGERDAALTVNEFETLLMKYDLAAVLRNPLRFMAEEYRSALANPRAVPGKALGYARYDLVRVLNSGLDTLGLQGSIVEKVLARTLAVPAARFFRMRRSISLLVAERDDGRPVVEGHYQSPILVQWQRGRAPRARARRHADRLESAPPASGLLGLRAPPSARRAGRRRPARPRARRSASGAPSGRTRSPDRRPRAGRPRRRAPLPGSPAPCRPTRAARDSPAASAARARGSGARLRCALRRRRLRRRAAVRFPLRVVGERRRRRPAPSSARIDGRHAVEQEAVVGDQHERAGELGEALLEHLERRDVEVVGRLVEDQQVGRLAHQPGDEDAGLLAARQVADRHVELLGPEQEALGPGGDVDRTAPPR